jgi:hypothetical protein
MSDTRPSRAYVAGVYAKRILRWQSTSYPHITIDAFSRLADFRINPVAWRLNERNSMDISRSQVIFCRGEDLEGLLNSNLNIKPKVIICGNSDYEFHTLPKSLPKSLRALFLQNSYVSDNETVFTIPIGIENLRWGVNGHPKLLKKVRPNKVKDEILFGPFGETHSIRKEVFTEFTLHQGPWTVLPSSRISANEYSEIARQYRYVAAVRGNGVDTHRLWESLYRGIIPLVQIDSWSLSLQHLGLPIQFLSNWSARHISDLYDKLPKECFNPQDYEPLWMPYWENKIKGFLD